MKPFERTHDDNPTLNEGRPAERRSLHPIKPTGQTRSTGLNSEPGRIKVVDTLRYPRQTYYRGLVAATRKTQAKLGYALR
jgi:hypothetical protein